MTIQVIFVKQQFMPDELKKRRLWEAQDNAAEQKHAERMKALWGEDEFRNNPYLIYPILLLPTNTPTTTKYTIISIILNLFPKFAYSL